MTVPTCDHFPNLKTEAVADGDVCRQCIEMGDTWVHLRSCLGCGRVGCCDQSKNQHARGHWEEHAHPLIKSIEPGETWRYCFPDHFLVK